jgi:hypothetical protein
MPATGPAESPPVETAQRLAARLRAVVPAAVYSELVQLLIAEPGADLIDQAAALLWKAHNPDLPPWRELGEDVRADFRAFLDDGPGR